MATGAGRVGCMGEDGGGGVGSGAAGTGPWDGSTGAAAGPGRWERLFADLTSELDAADSATLEAEVSDRTRREFTRLRLVDRLRAAIGHRVGVALPAEGQLDGVLREVGPDWMLLAENGMREVLVPLAAVCGVTGLGLATAMPGSEGVVAARLDLRYALRRLARDRAPLALRLADRSLLHGTCDRVGSDFLEVAEHDPGEPRRPGAVRRVRAVPLTAVVAVRAG